MVDQCWTVLTPIWHRPLSPTSKRPRRNLSLRLSCSRRNGMLGTTPASQRSARRSSKCCIHVLTGPAATGLRCQTIPYVILQRPCSVRHNHIQLCLVSASPSKRILGRMAGGALKPPCCAQLPSGGAVCSPYQIDQLPAGRPCLTLVPDHAGCANGQIKRNGGTVVSSVKCSASAEAESYSAAQNASVKAGVPVSRPLQTFSGRDVRIRHAKSLACKISSDRLTEVRLCRARD
jgi:hypothetical protein